MSKRKKSIRRRRRRRTRRKQRGGTKKLCSNLFLPKGQSWNSFNDTMGTYYSRNLSTGPIPNNSSSVPLGSVMSGGGISALVPSHLADIGRGMGDWTRNAVNTYQGNEHANTAKTWKHHYGGQFD